MDFHVNLEHNLLIKGDDRTYLFNNMVCISCMGKVLCIVDDTGRSTVLKSYVNKGKAGYAMYALCQMMRFHHDNYIILADDSEIPEPPANMPFISEIINSGKIKCIKTVEKCGGKGKESWFCIDIEGNSGIVAYPYELKDSELLDMIGQKYFLMRRNDLRWPKEDSNHINFIPEAQCKMCHKGR